MELFERVVTFLNDFIWSFGIPIRGEEIPWVVILLLGTGVFLTLRLSFIQVTRLVHGIAITSGKYDDPDEPGDVPHYQALTTALSATVGIGNIAGVAIAIHFGGPGALFWMWVTAFLGMATKYTEVTLSMKYRDVEEGRGELLGTVSGGPMYYIERGMGAMWKPMGIFFAAALGFTAFITGNAIQANTVADTMNTTFGMPVFVTGIITSAIVAAVVLGGIRRIGRVTSILAPTMAVIYVVGALWIIVTHAGDFLPALKLVFAEAFNPTSGVAGTGVGAILVTMMWGVKRGLFSNEAGQGSAPIAHAAAQTDEPVSEGVVALLGPLIDTLIICSLTGLVIIMTGVWKDTVPTELTLSGGDGSYVTVDDSGSQHGADAPEEILIRSGKPAATGPDDVRYAWHESAVGEFFVDEAMQNPFSGVIRPGEGVAIAADGTSYPSLYGPAVENAAPLTMLGFSRGLPGEWGKYIVLASVFLFAISTAISWSYYGDRCADYLFGDGAIIPYKIVFVIMHFFGSVVSLKIIWDLGDLALGIVILPNLIALVYLAGKVAKETDSYFERKPWLENYAKRQRLKGKG